MALNLKQIPETKQFRFRVKSLGFRVLGFFNAVTFLRSDRSASQEACTTSQSFLRPSPVYGVSVGFRVAGLGLGHSV